MPSTLTRDAVLQNLTDYVRNAFLDGDPQAELDAKTPLLQWGVLTSMNTALLLTHVRTQLGVTVPPDKLTGTNFSDLDSISRMVAGLATTAA